MQTSSSSPNCFLQKPSSGFFLPQISFPSSIKVPSLPPLASVCTWGPAVLGWKSLYLHCLLAYNCSIYRKGCLTVLPSPDSSYTASHHFSPRDTWFVNLNYQKGCWMYLSPIKSKAIPQSSEWHHPALPNYKNQFFSPSYHRTTWLPPCL